MQPFEAFITHVAFKRLFVLFILIVFALFVVNFIYRIIMINIWCNGQTLRLLILFKMIYCLWLVYTYDLKAWTFVHVCFKLNYGLLLPFFGLHLCCGRFLPFWSLINYLRFWILSLFRLNRRNSLLFCSFFYFHCCFSVFNAYLIARNKRKNRKWPKMIYYLDIGLFYFNFLLLD